MHAIKFENTNYCVDVPIPPPRVDSSKGPTPGAQIGKLLYFFGFFFGPWKKWPQMAPNRAVRIFPVVVVSSLPRDTRGPGLRRNPSHHLKAEMPSGWRSTGHRHQGRDKQKGGAQPAAKPRIHNRILSGGRKKGNPKPPGETLTATYRLMNVASHPPPRRRPRDPNL